MDLESGQVDGRSKVTPEDVSAMLEGMTEKERLLAIEKVCHNCGKWDDGTPDYCMRDD